MSVSSRQQHSFFKDSSWACRWDIRLSRLTFLSVSPLPFFAPILPAFLSSVVPSPSSPTSYLLYLCSSLYCSVSPIFLEFPSVRSCCQLCSHVVQLMFIYVTCWFNKYNFIYLWLILLDVLCSFKTSLNWCDSFLSIPCLSRVYWGENCPAMLSLWNFKDCEMLTGHVLLPSVFHSLMFQTLIFMWHFRGSN